MTENVKNQLYLGTVDTDTLEGVSSVDDSRKPSPNFDFPWEEVEDDEEAEKL